MDSESATAKTAHTFITVVRFVVCAFGVLILLFLGLIFHAFYYGSPERARSNFVGVTFRNMAIAETAYKGSVGNLSVKEEYWGPWTAEMHQVLVAVVGNQAPAFEVVLDPYNSDAKDGGIRGGIDWNVDRGRATIKGASPHFYTDGIRLCAWASKGPDEDLDLSLEDFRKISMNPNASLGTFEALYAPLAEFLYDPTNGTASSGDMIRIDVFE